MRMWKGKKSKMLMGALLVITLIAGILITPLQYAFAYGADGAQDIGRGKYYDLPETVEKYVSSGKTLEFDLNFEIKSTDNCQLKLYNGATQVSAQFFLRDGANGLIMETEELSDGWYHYIIFLASVPHSDSQTDSSVNKIRVMTTFPDGAKINNITIGIDLLSLPEAFTNDYDEITLADLGLTGKDFETSIQKATYEYKGKSSTKSVILRFGWRAKITDETDPDTDFRFALDSLYNANCMVWFRPDKIYFCPGQGKYAELKMTADPVIDGDHQIEFGRLRVTQGQNYGKDYIYLEIDGNKVCEEYTNYYQTKGGYVSHMSGEETRKTSPSYTVAFLGDGLSQQTFSGFAAPDKCAEDTDFVNIGDIVPGGVVKDSVHDGHLGYTYHFDSLSETHSTVVKFLLKTGDFKDGALDGSVMVVDIGGNCGFCRSYISSGDKRHIMFGWEIDGCINGTNSYKFESNTWYAFEQGRRRVVSGLNAGKDYVYIKIDGKIISYFYAEPTSRPLLGQDIYIEATEGFEVMGYDEIYADYYVDDSLYLDQLAQRGFPAKQPEDPKKTGSYFVGWYTEKTGGELFDFKNTKLTESIDLYARFTTETVNVTFKPANGEASTNGISGKGCLVTEPPAPTHTDSEYVFAGWKNENTGKIFDFKVDRLSADTTFIAQYEEKKYYVSYYANGKLVDNVSFTKNNPSVTGNEPKVPSIPNTTGVWEPHATEGLTGNMTVNAVYTTTVPSPSNDIKLNKYDGGKIYINTDTVHSYLSTDLSKQSDFVKEYTASTYKYQDYQNTSFEWNDTGDNSKYTVYFADNSSFNNAYIIKTKKTSLVNEVGIFVPGKTYYWFVCGNDTGKCSEVDIFTVVNTPVRYINAGSVINMRDLGGQVNSNGDKVKYELIYRGAALDEYTSHIDDKARGVFNYLGIKSEIELRGGKQHSFTGWDENNPNAYYVKGAMYQEILPDEYINSESIKGIDAEQKGQYKAVFEALADSSNYPFYFHCSAGADRTGTLAYLLYGLLGVPYEDIRPEYELTSFSAIGKRTGDLYSGEKSLDETNRIMIENYSGGTGNLQTAIENYLINVIGLDSSTLESIKNILLDKNAEPNEQQYTITVDVLGKKSTYKAFSGIYFMPDAPMAKGKLFKGFYIGDKEYEGYTSGDITLTARFEDIEFEPYDVISLKDLGIDEAKILNQTNKLYSYNGIAKSGGRSFQFILEPIGDMKKGDGPQIALTNDWEKNSFARVWFQTNSMAQVYYNGVLGSGPDISKSINLESGKHYNVEYAVRVMKNKGYEGQKVFEVSVDDELIVQYIGCGADLDSNTIYFHGGAGSVYLINKVVTNENLRTVTVDVLGNKSTYKTFSGEYLMPEEPKVMGKLFKGFYDGSKKYSGYTTSNITLTAKFEDIEYESYDVISLKDLGIKDKKSVNQTNKLYTYDGIAKSGGRLLQFTLEPIGDMNGGDGPQISFTNNWSKNSFARVWFQTNSKAQIYYNGKLGSGPDITKTVSLESGKQYDIQYAVRIMKNKGYEGKKVFEVSVDGEVLVQYIGCDADLSEKTIYFHGSTGSAYFINKQVSNEKQRTITVDVLGKKTTYKTFMGDYFMPEEPKVMGKFFKGFYIGDKEYSGYTYDNITLTAKFEDIEFEPYDTISLKDLGIKEDKSLNKTNTVYTYEKTAESGGRLLQFILEPVGDMKGGDGPQVALTSDWAKNSFARVWFQNNTQSHVYYNGALGSGPDITKSISLESGKQYEIQYAIRIMKSKGYEGKELFEVSVNGELIIQYIGCKADLDNNTIYFHGGTGSAYLINNPVYKTVNFFNGNNIWASYKVERSGLIPRIQEPSPKDGLPFAGWYTAASGGKLWDENADVVLNDMNLFAHFANVRLITANVDGKIYIYRVEVGKTLDELPKPKKPGNVFMGWFVNGKPFTGKVASNLDITASFEPYSFDDYDEISLRDLGIYTDLDFAIFGDRHTRGYNYYKAAKTGGRVFKAIYIPPENMINGPQVSFSTKWDENYFAKLYFTKYDKLYVYSSGIDGGLPTLNMDTELLGGKEYFFEIGVRVLNNKGYKGVKVLTVYINGELIFEEFDNKANIEGDTVFFQGLPNTGIFRNVDIYKTVSFYDGDRLVSSAKVLRGDRVKSIGSLANKGDRLFLGWYSEYGHIWDFDLDSVYLDTVLKSKYRIRTYPVLLMVDDVLYKRLNVSAGESVDIFDTPYKEGYEFDKWLSEDGSEYDLSTPVKGPTTLFASFKLSAKPSSKDSEVDLGGQEKSGAIDFRLILFSAIGLAFIGAETGIIIFKKRSKR